MRIAGVSLEISVHGDERASFWWVLPAPAISSPSGVWPYLPSESELFALLWWAVERLLPLPPPVEGGVFREGGALREDVEPRMGSEIGTLDLAAFST